MSYGYLVASTNPIPELQKHRRYRFLLIDSSKGFYVYSRLEESHELTTRQGEKSVITAAGKVFFSSIPTPFFFMDYLLIKKQCEADVAQIAKKTVRIGSFKTIRITTVEEFSLNCLYEILP